MSDDPLLGTDVGRYRLDRVLGQGGMGRVYLGVQPQIGSRVAIKVLSEECARDPQLLERFFAEARAVNMIRHEHIALVLDLAQLPDGRPYIVMEFVDGGTLADLLRTGPAPLGSVVQVMREVLSALAAAHAIGIVHRDLKPDNILVTGEGHAKVLDFGIAKLGPGLLANNSPRTATGALLGTPAYMSPEQISGAGAVDARTDVYAAGIVLFEAVTGQAPFAGATLFELLRQHLEAPPPSPRALRPELPAELEQVILRALAKAPEQRYADAAEMEAALSHVAMFLPPAPWRPRARRASLDALGATVASTSQQGAGQQLPPPVFSPPPPQQQLVYSQQPPVAAPPPPSPPHAAPTIVTRGHGRLLILATAAVVIVGIAAVAGVVALKLRNDGARGRRSSSGDSTSSSSSTSTVTSGSSGSGSSGGGSSGGGSSGSGGVQIGPGVTLEEIGRVAPPPAVPEQPALDFMPSHFDPIAYLPTAQARARALIPDADFTEFEMYENVWSDGHVDLTLPVTSTSYYEFRSPKASVRAPGVPLNTPRDRPCYVMVDVTAQGATARVRADDECDHQLHTTPPVCTLAAVWQLAIADHEPAKDVVATIGFLHDGTWFFDLHHSDHPPGAQVHSYPDCR